MSEIQDASTSAVLEDVLDSNTFREAAVYHNEASVPRTYVCMRFIIIIDTYPVANHASPGSVSFSPSSYIGFM